MAGSKTPPISRNTPHYHRGAKAYRAQKDASTCPYPIGDKRRVGWMSGWLDARTNERLGEIFKKHQIEFP